MGRHFARRAVGAIVTCAVFGGPTNAGAGFGAPTVVVAPDDPPDPEDGPARRYARLGRGDCEAELDTRGISFTRVEGARGVLAPIRLQGNLHGVVFHSGAPAAQRDGSPWDIVDCRLALALDDFAAQLSAHGIIEVLHYSIYRPPSTEWPSDRVATRHPGALAIDAASFTKSDGSKLDVERDFHGRIGAVPCGRGAIPSPATPAALELRRIVCEAAESKLFNVALTPNFNRAHRNHFHLEVAAGSKWFTVR
jgi:hypothetical protein